MSIVELCICRLTGFKEELDKNVSISVYGLDSLSRVELVIALEDEFNIRFNESDLTQRNFETINDINKLLTSKYGITL